MVQTLPRSQWSNEHHYWVWKQQRDVNERLTALNNTVAAAIFLADRGPFGVVFDFADASIALTTDNPAEMELFTFGPSGLVVDFADQSVAFGTP